MAGGRIRAFDESVLSAAFDMLLVNYLLAYPADRLIKCGAVVRPLQCEKFILEPSLNRNPDFNHKSLANQYVIRRLYYFHLFAALFPFFRLTSTVLIFYVPASHHLLCAVSADAVHHWLMSGLVLMSHVRVKN